MGSLSVRRSYCVSRLFHRYLRCMQPPTFVYEYVERWVLPRLHMTTKKISRVNLAPLKAVCIRTTENLDYELLPYRLERNSRSSKSPSEKGKHVF
jgi:hypothetical protein